MIEQNKQSRLLVIRFKFRTMIQPNQLLQEVINLIQEGDLRELSKLVSKNKVDLVYLNSLCDSSLLFVSALMMDQERSLSMLKYLIGQGINPREMKSSTSLVQFAIQMGSLSILQYLIQTNLFPITYINEKYQSLLHLAIESNSSEIAQYLIERRIDLNTQDYNGSTPLHYAVMVISLQLAQLLIKRGADPRVKNTDDETPEELATKLKYHPIASFLRKQEPPRSTYTLYYNGSKVPVHSLKTNPQLQYLTQLKPPKGGKLDIKRVDNWQSLQIKSLQDALTHDLGYLFKDDLQHLYLKLFTNSFKKKQNYTMQRSKLFAKHESAYEGHPAVLELLNRILSRKS